ncbi:type IV toxin-antitoxin system AbiEi family antitoxin domain-containing protein [Nocardioides sp. MAHUQ-72]|uniref:type IV toxin-antitoxin system AbiEi family antitoxin domain-containing protein n=1 Tax=unclassified Nocardioides TaxID=2615069 RepID=UPI00361CA162
MHPRDVAAFARHGNLLTRKQALEAGVSIEQIDAHVRSGRWVAVRRSVYALREFWDALDEWQGRPLYVARAASAAMRKPHVMSHDSAALELGLELLAPQRSLVHVTRPGVLGTRTEHGVKHHKAPYRPEQVVEVDGRRVLDMARTVADISRDRGLDAGVVTADAAMRAGVTRAELRVALEPMRNWPNVTIGREVADLADPGAENGGESLARMLVTELGQGRPQTQFGLTDGRREVWCDLRLGRHIFEFDGWLKYRLAQQGGFARVSPEQALREEKQRQDFICGFKLGVSRIVPEDLRGGARERARARLLREYLDTTARFGTSIADLEPFLIQRTRRRAS